MLLLLLRLPRDAGDASECVTCKRHACWICVLVGVCLSECVGGGGVGGSRVWRGSVCNFAEACVGWLNTAAHFRIDCNLVVVNRVSGAMAYVVN